MLIAIFCYVYIYTLYIHFIYTLYTLYIYTHTLCAVPTQNAFFRISFGIFLLLKLKMCTLFREVSSSNCPKFTKM